MLITSTGGCTSGRTRVLIVSVTTWAGFTVPTLKDKVLPLILNAPWEVEAETTSSSFGTVSVTTMPVAGKLPRLVFVIVKSTFSPGLASCRLLNFTITGSAMLP